MPSSSSRTGRRLTGFSLGTRPCDSDPNGYQPARIRSQRPFFGEKNAHAAWIRAQLRIVELNPIGYPKTRRSRYFVENGGRLSVRRSRICISCNEPERSEHVTEKSKAPKIYIMPPGGIPGAPPPKPLSSGFSATMHSVVKSRPATEAAFCSALRTTLV